MISGFKVGVIWGRGSQTVGPPQGRAILEASPVCSSGSNGVIERAVQAIEGQVRTIELALESRIGVEIPSDHDVVPWIVEYAATIINKGQVGADGKTAYIRLKGKPAHLSGLEFGLKDPLGKFRPGSGKEGQDGCRLCSRG